MISEKVIRDLWADISANIGALKIYAKKKDEAKLYVEKRKGESVLVLAQRSGGKLQRRKFVAESDEGREFLYRLLNQRRLEVLGRNQAVLGKVVEEVEDDSVEAAAEWLMARYSGISRELLEEVILERAGREQPRLKFAFVQNLHKEDRFDNRHHRTSFGLCVRSKSEVLIAESLHQHGVAFEYEPCLRFDGVDLRPDFWVSANGKTFLWEHFGMTHDADYREQIYYKLDLYRRQGFVLWDNLICTFDDNEGYINMEEVEFVIKQRLLK